MTDEAVPRPTTSRWRWVVLIGLAVAAVGGAVTVFVVGSSQREDDRERVLTYETQVLAHVREMNVVVGSLADAVAAFRARRVDAETLSRTAEQYARTLHAVAQKLAVVRPPAAVGENAESFGPPARLYAAAADAVRTAAECARRGDAACATNALRQHDRDATDALARYRVAVRALQAARERLGLAPSPNFGDPPR